MATEPVRTPEHEEKPLEDTVVKIYRCAKVVKGGRRFSFAALVVVGDREGTVGLGYGKANEVPLKFRATKIVLVPASPGTGVIAGSSARAVLEYAGVHDVLTKIYGSTSAKNVVKATLNGLLKLRNKEMIETLRGVAIS